MDAICRNVRQKQLVVLKDPNQAGMQDRINKMRNRGWGISYK